MLQSYKETINYSKKNKMNKLKKKKKRKTMWNFSCCMAIKNLLNEEAEIEATNSSHKNCRMKKQVQQPALFSKRSFK